MKKTWISVEEKKEKKSDLNRAIDKMFKSLGYVPIEQKKK